MFTRRPAVPSRRRTVPRRVNIEFVSHALGKIYSTVYTIFHTRSNMKKAKEDEEKKVLIS